MTIGTFENEQHFALYIREASRLSVGDFDAAHYDVALRYLAERADDGELLDLLSQMFTYRQINGRLEVTHT